MALDVAAGQEPERAKQRHQRDRHQQVDGCEARHIGQSEVPDENGRKGRGQHQRDPGITEGAVQDSRKIVENELTHVADRLADQNRIALEGAVENQLKAMNEQVQNAIERNISLSESSTAQLTTQLKELDELADNLEKRIAESRNSFDGIDDDSFARRMVLLTESLNSTSIDVAKILSNEVTDTAWAAYLKGDRGVFTRRAVRLLDAGESRAIATHYGQDAEFREHVNRYIHDFEAMMRILLSTRDGNAICVTLLSSDVGKLYVALAQAIERLRN